MTPTTDSLYRARLEAIRSEIDALEADAMETTVILSSLSSEQRRRRLGAAYFRYYREQRPEEPSEEVPVNA